MGAVYSAARIFCLDFIIINGIACLVELTYKVNIALLLFGKSLIEKGSHLIKITRLYKKAKQMLFFALIVDRRLTAADCFYIPALGRPLTVLWSHSATEERPRDPAFSIICDGVHVPSEKTEWVWRSQYFFMD